MAGASRGPRGGHAARRISPSSMSATREDRVLASLDLTMQAAVLGPRPPEARPPPAPPPPSSASAPAAPSPSKPSRPAKKASTALTDATREAVGGPPRPNSAAARRAGSATTRSPSVARGASAGADLLAAIDAAGPLQGQRRLLRARANVSSTRRRQHQRRRNGQGAGLSRSKGAARGPSRVAPLAAPPLSRPRNRGTAPASSARPCAHRGAATPSTLRGGEEEAHTCVRNVSMNVPRTGTCEIMIAQRAVAFDGAFQCRALNRVQSDGVMVRYRYGSTYQYDDTVPLAS